jgi:hypothetical protein
MLVGVTDQHRPGRFKPRQCVQSIAIGSKPAFVDEVVEVIRSGKRIFYHDSFLSLMVRRLAGAAPLRVEVAHALRIPPTCFVPGMTPVQERPASKYSQTLSRCCRCIPS